MNGLGYFCSCVLVVVVVIALLSFSKDLDQGGSSVMRWHGVGVSNSIAKEGCGSRQA